MIKIGFTIMSLWFSDKFKFVFELKEAKELLKSSYKVFDAALVVLKRYPKSWSSICLEQSNIQEFVSYIYSVYLSEELAPFCRAWYFLVVRRCLFSKHISRCHWDDFYIKDIVRCLLRQQVYSKYPYQEGTVNEWFSQMFALEEEEESTNPKTVKMINVPGKSDKGKPPCLKNGSLPKDLQEEGFVVLFHGTNHKSAVDIIEEGIDLDKGARKKDFSDDKGFYLGDKYEYSIDFVRKRRPAAVLIFKVPKSELENFNSVDLQKDNWYKIVGQCRKGNMPRELKKTSYVEGPIASTDYAKGNVNGKLQGTYQMCLLDKRLGRVFDRHLHSVVFFEY